MLFSPLAVRTVFRCVGSGVVLGVMKGPARWFSVLGYVELTYRQSKFLLLDTRTLCVHTVYRWPFYFAAFLIQFHFMLLNRKKVGENEFKLRESA